MRDDFLTHDWADNHHRFHLGFHKLIEAITVGLDRANRYQFDAPWRSAGFR